MIALEGRFAYSFLAGIFAAVNPCGFVLLPTYLMYFLGLEGARPGTQRASIQRALTVSAATSAGFISVFVIVGTISRGFTTVIEDNAVVVQTARPDVFYARLTDLAASGELGAIHEVTSPDDNLQAVFQYLVKS